VAMTGQAVTSYGVGLIGLIFVKILAPGFYAKQDIKTPVKIAIIVLLATQVMNLMFVPFIKHAGLALSVGLGACINAVMLYRGLRGRGIYVPEQGWMSFLVKLGAALTLMAGVALALSGQVDWIGMKGEKLMRVALLGGIIVACMLTYFSALLAMGFRVKDFRKAAR
jgi:putative peptidoglycan lipid II flippase